MNGDRTALLVGLVLTAAGGGCAFTQKDELPKERAALAAERAQLAAERVELRAERERLAKERELVEQARAMTSRAPRFFDRPSLQAGTALEAEGRGQDAVRLYIQAARSGNCEAAKRLGEIYDGGIPGIRRDYAESLRWFNAARVLGCDVALPRNKG